MHDAGDLYGPSRFLRLPPNVKRTALNATEAVRRDSLCYFAPDARPGQSRSAAAAALQGFRAADRTCCFPHRQKGAIL